MIEKCTITILKKWHHPQILMTVNNEVIELKMSLEQFQEVLISEALEELKVKLPDTIGPIKWVFNQRIFEMMVKNALDGLIRPIISKSVDAAISAIKGETVKMGHV
jgi:hypothetical protein